MALVAALAAVIAGTAALGVAAGFLWAAVAPHAAIVVIGRGAADIVNPETSAYIAADGWFALISVAGGIISGLAGYLLAVRRHGPAAMGGVLAGALAGALVARWIGQQPGRSAINHSLALGHAGTMLHQPLVLGGIGPLAFWPLAAAIIAGGIEFIAAVRARGAQPAGLAAPHAGPLPPPGPAGQPGMAGPPPGGWPPDQPQPGQLPPPS